MKLRFHLYLFLLLAGMLSLPARAQDSSPLSALYLSSDFYGCLVQNVGRPTLIAGQRSVLGRSGPPPKTTTRRDGVTETLIANLDYRPSSGISRTLREQISLNVSAADPQQMSQIRSVFSTDWMWQRFDSLLRQAGYNARNLADVMAAYYVSAWEIVHGATADRDDSEAARERIAQSLKHSPEIMFMSDAEKQRSAEAFGMLTTVATAGSRSMLHEQDAVGYATLQQQIRQAFLWQGIDMGRLNLTPEGFVYY
jgi:hypothetical protein